MIERLKQRLAELQKQEEVKVAELNMCIGAQAEIQRLITELEQEQGEAVASPSD